MCPPHNIHLLPSLALLGCGCYPSATLCYPWETTSPACSWPPGCARSRELGCSGPNGDEGNQPGAPLQWSTATATVPCRTGPPPHSPAHPAANSIHNLLGALGAASRPHHHLPSGCCHDTAALLRGGLHTAARAVVAHAKIVADFVGHSGGCSDGLLRVVLHRDGGCVSAAAKSDGEG